MAAFDVEREKRAISREYMNAALQRAKKLPRLRDLVEDRKPPKLQDIIARLSEKKSDG